MNASELPLPFVHDMLTDRRVAIKVIGVGGAGSNVVDRLKMENLDRLGMAVINTDAQALAASPVEEKVLIGASVTRGLGAGGDPDLGRQAAEADREKIAAVLRGCDLVFLVAGMGGGTGSGAAPVVAEIATELGALVIAFVTLPFSFEGGRRGRQADEALTALRRECDAVIPLANDLLLHAGGEDESVLDSFARADEWIGRGVKSVWAMLNRTGLINLDFATLRQAFHTRGGKTLFGLASGSGPDAAGQAIDNLKHCPLLAMPEFARKPDRLLVNILGGTDLTLARVNQVMTAVTDQFGREAHVIMGAVIDETLQGRLELMVLGTTDLGGRIYAAGAARARAARQRAAGVGAASAEGAPKAGVSSAEAQPAGLAVGDQESENLGAGAGAKASSVRAKGAGLAARSSVPTQGELALGELETRGEFEKTDRNLFEGQDLDVPTFIRRGLKLQL